MLWLAENTCAAAFGVMVLVVGVTPVMITVPVIMAAAQCVMLCSFGFNQLQIDDVWPGPIQVTTSARCSAAAGKSFNAVP